MRKRWKVRATTGNYSSLDMAFRTEDTMTVSVKFFIGIIEVVFVNIIGIKCNSVACIAFQLASVSRVIMVEALFTNDEKTI